MKKKCILGLIAGVFLLSQAGCGSNTVYNSEISSQSASNGMGFTIDSTSASDSSYNNKSYDDVDDSYTEGESYAEESTDSVSSDIDIDDVKSNSDLNLDMLIYKCDVTIDTLTYQDAYDGLLKLVSDNGGFIESSNVSDGGNTYSYYYTEDTDKHMQATLTIRIPSKNYELFINSFGDLGDIRSLNSNVENVTQEYTDSKTALKIYREQEKRYISMIADADPSYAMQLQSELTDLEVKIAQLESRMRSIRNDVAYSYVYVTLREVEKYALHGKTNTFAMRLRDNWSDSWQQFRNFLESVLTFIIYAWYYVVLVIIIFVLARKGNKAWRKKHPKKGSKKKYYPVYTKDGVANVSPEVQEKASELVDKMLSDDTDSSDNKEKEEE